LEVDTVSKSYGAKLALHDVSLILEPGIYALLGPNGAGKSTLMGVITGGLRADSGSVTWNGTDIRRLGSSYRARLGYVPQQGSYYPEFTATRFLYYMATLKGLGPAQARRQVPRLLEAVGLTAVAGRRVKTFSGGMRQRLLIAQSLLGDPELLVMDEPMSGLDPRQRESFRRLIAEGSERRIVLVSTHVVSDIEWISKGILLLRDGELIAQGSREQLVAGLSDCPGGEGHPEGRPLGLEGRPEGRPPGLEDVYLHLYGERDDQDGAL